MVLDDCSLTLVS